MTIGTPFHGRTAALNQKLAWRDWSGYFAASAYADSLAIEYNAIREAAALIDVSPLYKYRLEGPDAGRLVDRIVTRDASRLAVGQVAYTPWCDEDGKVIDDGTIARLDEHAWRWTAADPQLRWFELNAGGLDVRIEEISESVAAVALQGPRARDVLEAASGEDWADLRYYRRRASRLAGHDIDVSRTGYTGDLGYELWIPAPAAPEVWDALMAAGAPYGLRPAGMLALDVARLEAGLILIEVDYTSSRQALAPEERYSPTEIGLGRLVALDKDAPFVGCEALRAERSAGGPARRLVGLRLSWDDIAARFAEHGLTPSIAPEVSRTAVPILSHGRHVGRATSLGWSPMRKEMVALASVPSRFEAPGTQLEVEWTVAGRRGPVGAMVVPLPFFDPPRKKA
ncbi:MAG TPA: aminomethyltransferase family protein [Candidatus Limnocylindrales bacterium]|nr:aminomethyltransferase family protein [Candidatus Limnocylindrales bacterium]